MTYYQELPSNTIAVEIGERIARLRLSRNLPQSQLAKVAGISKRTLTRFEAGDGASLDTFLRLLIALGIANNLGTLLPETEIRPLERAAHKGKQRQRARPTAVSVKAPWTWGDEPQ